MARPLIALLTDFGLRDHYVGVMKGVMLGICPDVTLVDLSHDIPAQDVTAAALELAASCQYFPAGTIFLVVVDPGVGTPRRGIAADTGEYRLVGPDNGVLSLVFEQTPPLHVVELSDPRYARTTISRTFEGRDRFAPAAAWLAAGVALSALGPPVGSLVELRLPTPIVTADGIQGQVVRVDRFGNLITNIDSTAIEAISTIAGVDIGTRHIDGLVTTYADASAGELCALIGSSDQLEVAVSGGNAAESLGLGRGAAVHVRRGA